MSKNDLIGVLILGLVAFLLAVGAMIRIDQDERKMKIMQEEIKLLYAH